ncbi:MAG: hypothetical protein EBZ60_07680, partial [Betaproteobacteria bacterium]|nr:hypothetical protein [Betaproteobacteria bacterium]
MRGLVNNLVLVNAETSAKDDKINRKGEKKFKSGLNESLRIHLKHLIFFLTRIGLGSCRGFALLML